MNFKKIILPWRRKICACEESYQLQRFVFKWAQGKPGIYNRRRKVRDNSISFITLEETAWNRLSVTFHGVTSMFFVRRIYLGFQRCHPKRRNAAVLEKNGISWQSLLKRCYIFVTFRNSQRALPLSVVLTIECCRPSVIGVFTDHIWSFICHIPGSVVNNKPFYCAATSSAMRCVQVT